MDPLDSSKILVLSLGTGIPKEAEKYNAEAAAKWGLLGWVYKRGNTPLLDVFGDASSDMVDIHVSTLFQSLHTQKNYLRIQVIYINLLLSKYIQDFIPRRPTFSYYHIIMLLKNLDGLLT